MEEEQLAAASAKPVIPAQGLVDKPKITPLVPHSLLCVHSEDVAKLTIYTGSPMCLFLLIGESDTFSTGPQAGICLVQRVA